MHRFPSAEPTPYIFTIHLYLLLSNFSGAQKTILRRSRTLRGHKSNEQIATLLTVECKKRPSRTGCAAVRLQ